MLNLQGGLGKGTVPAYIKEKNEGEIKGEGNPMRGKRPHRGKGKKKGTVQI